MGGRINQCSFCRKVFSNGAAVAAHERECVMLEHGRHVPRDAPLPFACHRAGSDPTCGHVFVKIIGTTKDIPVPYMFCTRCGATKDVEND